MLIAILYRIYPEQDSAHKKPQTTKPLIQVFFKFTLSSVYREPEVSAAEKNCELS